MTAVRDTLCNLRPLEIPRPHISGLQFIPTRGRLGFYKSIRREGAQYGIQIKPSGPRRPALADACWGPIEPAKEINAESCCMGSNTSNTQRLEYPRQGQCSSLSSSDDESHTSSQLSNCSDDSSKKSPLDEPEYPEPDYDATTSVKIKCCDTHKTKI
uniref:Uncharacterized protein n=1 Tax=Parascaris univalens TaxID=6257 RepID=A0A914ZDE3_PARUN